ncbi:cellulose biosynthesis protein BcsD [Asaia spathodeae]|uniref:Cellulose synthase n=1 Tax=Asaia spathodeae TaxID=657016 RepID=A0ABX2P7W0_9PROT|nr:cellulose biosynthesis protein BcsD [Asaia spathodeae]GBR16646.1 hypothetical protein AA105894_1628 [Asaia spathodeae NBRC 105894]
MTAPDYSLFLHSLASELDIQAGAEERDALLQSVGLRAATRLPLPACETTEDFELECNALLRLMGWGRIALALSQEKHCLTLTINEPLRLGALGTPSGQWYAAFYAGLLTGWFQQTGEAVTLHQDKDASTSEILVFDAKG